jgi:hypothetical protein
MKKNQPYLFILFILFSASLFAQQDVPVENAQVIVEDLIVQGSIGIGFDAVDGENFGFDTFRLKENNLRMHFDDTSASASFPSNDWRIAINDTGNGGANYFAIQDATAGTTPFIILAGAGDNALFVKAGGDVGFGTATPVVNLHVADGDSPTLRLEQDGASGFTPQTWDIAGNESNFFIRDVTNGSKLPFKIKPGAPDNALFVAASGNIGLGTASPTHKLDVEGSADVRDNLYVGSQIGVGTVTPDANASLDLAATDKGLLLNRLDNAGRIALGDALITAGTGAGMMLYDTEDAQTYYWNGTVWVNPSIATYQNLTSATLSGTNITIDIDNGTSVDVDLVPILAPLQTAIIDLENVNSAQQTAITDLENVNSAQQTQIDDLIARMVTLEACACTTLTVVGNEETNLNRIILNQNVPNPFNTTTKIKYFIPTKYSSAKIVVTSSLGQILYDIPITKFGEGAIDFNKSSLQSAIYYYTLYVDGKNVETKRLVVN